MKKSLYICSCLVALLLTACEQNEPWRRTQRGWEIEDRWYSCARSMTSEFITEMFDVNDLLYADSLTRMQMAAQFADYAVFESVGDTLFVVQRYEGAMPHIIIVDNHRLTEAGAAWTLILNTDKNLQIDRQQKMCYAPGYFCSSGIGQVAPNTPVDVKCTAAGEWTFATPTFADDNTEFAMQWEVAERKKYVVSGIYVLGYALSGKGVFLLEQNVSLAYEMDDLAMYSLYNPDRFESGKTHITAQQLGTGETLDVEVVYAGTSKEITYRGVTETYY